MYEAPIKDLNFVIKNLIDLGKLNKVSDYSEFSDDLVEAVLEEAGKIASEVLDPCNLSGDHEGSKRLDTGEVVTPKGYKEAYEFKRWWVVWLRGQRKIWWSTDTSYFICRC